MLAKTEGTARDLIAELVKAKPGSSAKELFEEFQNRVAAQPLLQRTVDWYFFIQMFTEITAPPKRSTSPNPQGARAISAMKEAIKSKIVLLELTMPNGKRLKDCTGGEVATFGNRFKLIADRVGKSRLVGEVLSEEDLQKIVA